MQRSSIAVVLVSFLGALVGDAQLVESGPAPVMVLTQHNDNARSGANLAEKVLTPATVNKQRFGMIFKRQVDDQIYTQPLIALSVSIARNQRDLVIVTTVNNSVYAFDANDATNPKPIWHVNFGTPADMHSAAFNCTDINGKMGIIGAPVIDWAKTALYVVAITRVGDHYLQRLHALDLATGADLAESPRVIAAPDFDPLMQNQRPALALDRGNLYIAYASHCDKEPYHGFLLSYDAATLEQKAVLNLSPAGVGASIWQSGLGPAIDRDGNLYFVTGNGSWNGSTQWSESFLKVSPELKIVDWFTPTNHALLDKNDDDLNSSGAVLVPGTIGTLVIGGGKGGVLYSFDTEHLGHLGDEHALQHFKATGSHLHSLVYWESAKRGKLLYIWGQRDKARVYRLTGDKFDETPLMTRPEMNEGHPGAMLSLSADGGKDGILWAAIHATGDSWHESRPGVLHAYEADDITHELWNSLEVPARDDCGEYSKMAPPTIANGRVYLASFGTENVGTGQLCVYGLLPAGPPPAATDSIGAIIKDGFVTVQWDGVADATSFTVERRQDGKWTIAASGLTGGYFTEPVERKGPVEYRVYTVNANGLSVASKTATATIEDAPAARMAMPTN